MRSYNFRLALFDDFEEDITDVGVEGGMPLDEFFLRFLLHEVQNHFLFSGGAIKRPTQCLKNKRKKKQKFKSG